MCSIFPCSVWCVHSGNTGKLWKYTRNQNLSSPRGGCRAGILMCFHLFKPVKVDSVCVCVCVFVFAFVFVCVCVFVFVCVCVWYLSSCRHITGRSSQLTGSFLFRYEEGQCSQLTCDAPMCVCVCLTSYPRVNVCVRSFLVRYEHRQYSQ